MCRLDKKDGKTKERVETWRKNIKGLVDQTGKQIKLLEGLNEGVTSGGGGGGSGQDYFGLIIGKLAKDIEDTVRICEKLMTPYNLKKRVEQSEAKDRWTYLRQCIK